MITLFKVTLCRTTPQVTNSRAMSRRSDEKTEIRHDRAEGGQMETRTSRLRLASDAHSGTSRVDGAQTTSKGPAPDAANIRTTAGPGRRQHPRSAGQCRHTPRGRRRHGEDYRGTPDNGQWDSRHRREDHTADALGPCHHYLHRRVTAQGEDILAWLDNAITEREEAARAAHTTDPAPWTASTSPLPTSDHDREVGSGLLVAADGEPLWDCEGTSHLCMTAAASVHAALHDPESVMRRCAADRKLLELHRPTDCNGFGCDCGSCCATCRWTDADQSGAPARWGDVDQCVYPCPTVLAVAEGYGWTEGER